MSKLFLESLAESRLLVFKKLKAFKNIGVLGGGTALSLQIGHRISFDFDIFVAEKIGAKLWALAKEIFGQTLEKILNSEDQLDLVTPEGIAVTFFRDDYSSIFTPIETEVINLLDVRDIALNKAYVLGRRPKWRDYVDIFFLLRGKYISLENLVLLSRKKFGTDFSERLFMEQLVYWKDIFDYQIEFLAEKVPENTIKSFLESEIRNYKDKNLFK